MPYTSRQSKKKLLLFVLLVVCIMLVNVFQQLLPFRLTGNISIAFGLFILGWSMTLRRRILHRQTRRYLFAASVSLFLLFPIRMCRYDIFAGSPGISRFLWYLYYLPLLTVPLFSFFSVLWLGKEKADRPVKKFRWLWFIFFLLILLFLTNDLHHWVLLFAETPGMASKAIHNWCYYVYLLWQVSLLVASFLVLLKKSTLSSCRKYIFIPIGTAAFFTCFLVLYIYNNGSPALGSIKLYNFQEIYALLFIGVWEAFIQIGLVPSNSDYEEIFRISNTGAMLKNNKGEEKLLSANYSSFSEKQLLEVELQGSRTFGDIRLNTAAVAGGNLFWQEDLRNIHRMNNALEDAVWRLDEENTLLKEEQRIREAQAKYATKNRLYDRISTILAPQLFRIENLLKTAESGSIEDYNDTIAECTVLLSYVKRRANLLLLAEEQDMLPAGELYLAIAESMEYLRLQHITCRVSLQQDAGVSSLLLNEAFALYENILECASGAFSSVLVTLSTEGAFTMTILLDTSKDLSAEILDGAALCKEMALVKTTYEEGLTYVRLTQRKEGGL